MTDAEADTLTRAIEALMVRRDEAIRQQLEGLRSELRKIWLRLGGREVGEDGKPVIGLGEEVRLLKLKMSVVVLVGTVALGSLVALGVTAVFGTR